MSDEIYLVTGAVSGIGNAVVNLLLEKGHYVIGADIRETSRKHVNYQHEIFDQSQLQSIKNLTDRLTQKKYSFRSLGT